MTEDDLRDIISARDLSVKTLHAQLSERDNDINKQHALKLVRVKSHMDLRAKLQQSLDQNTALKMKYAESLSRRNGLEEDLDESKKCLNRLQTFINRKGLMATTIKDLPSEVLEMITNNLNPKDLAPCRLVSKSMSEAANNRFAKVFFSRRFHVASSYSVKAVVDITAHPFFGKHVTAVIMDGVRMTKYRTRSRSILWVDRFDEEEEVSNTYPPPFGDSEEKSANFLDNAFTRSGQCQSLLQRVFENIKGHGNSVEVGVGDCKYDNRVRSFGRKALFNRKVLYTYFMAETLALTLAAAEAAKCRIHRLHVDIKGEAGQDYPQESVHLDRVLSEFLIQNTSSPNKFTISVITSDLEFSWMEDHDEQYVIKYDGDESLLEVKNITFSAEKHTVFRHIGLVDNITRLYLPKMSLVELRLKDSNIGRSPYFITDVLGNSIKTLTDIRFEGITLWNSPRSWKPIMQSLASLPSLKKCLLHDLQTVVVTNRDHLYSISFPRDEEACLLEGENMRDNLQEIGRASAQGTEDLLKDAQEKSIDLLEQKVLHVRFNHISYASGIKIVVPNIQTQGSEV
ncbi:hypothetical protein D6C86_02800 [Aureobasidium pullulans]|uniref:F-box domain-containing protein n=1 Tax=Aureobasidium pullulans TaxID=5580 RepID=A0A4S9VBS9_AURPU|nr:hypothetical protein D6C94_01384 [Aureobasidium pullulans]THZ48477.1 hypothetical protein D6C87_00684 [Aureobasidium pullulans]THZ63862.1 hypothetical protein D6C86_02800 [Aureobasidium pullulans]